MALVHETVKAELNARRQGTPPPRPAAEVAMTGAKAFRQKGTGRARAGALSTPAARGRRRRVRAQAAPVRRQGQPQGAPAGAALRAVRARRAAARSRSSIPPTSTRRRPRAPPRPLGRASAREARCSCCGARGRGDRRQVVPQHRARRRAARRRGRACATSSARRGSCSRRAAARLPHDDRPQDAKRRRPHERPQRPHPPDRLREELRAARGQQVHVPRRRPRAQDAGPPGRGGDLRRARARRPHDEREVEAQAARLHVGQVARVEEGDRPAPSRGPHRAVRRAQEIGE